MNNFLQTDSDMLDLDEPIEIVAELEKPEQGLEIHIGSNVFRTTNGVITLQGKEQIVVEVRPDPAALLLTMDFYDDQGQRIGHIRRNTLSAAAASRLALSTNSSPESSLDHSHIVTVLDRNTGNHVIEVHLFQRRKIRVASGNFRTHRGEPVSISPHYCRIGSGLTRFGDVIESRGGAASIG